MLNYIWAGMLLLGMIYGVCTGHAEELTSALLEGAGEGISLCITMAGVVAFWMGFMEIGMESGLIGAMSKKVEPILRFCFPNIPKGHPVMEYISANVIANVLGLGWACTSTGLKAMNALVGLEVERGNADYMQNEGGVRVASREMCTFLILNISSLQLLPLNIIAYRDQYGSEAPAAIVGPALIATLVSTLAAVIFCKIQERRSL